MVLEKIRSLKARRPKNRPLATGGSYPAVADGKLHATFVRSVDFSRLSFARGLKPTRRGNRAESQKTARGFLIASLFRDHGTKKRPGPFSAPSFCPSRSAGCAEVQRLGQSACRTCADYSSHLAPPR